MRAALTRSGMPNNTLRWTLFSEFFTVLKVSFENCVRKIDSVFGGCVSCGRQNAKFKDYLVEGCEDLQTSGCAVEDEVQVCSVFCLGSENWSWSQAILDRIEGCDTKAMRRLFRFKKKVDEDFTGYCQGTAPEQFGQR